MYEFKHGHNRDIVNKIKIYVSEIQDQSSSAQSKLQAIAHLIMVNDWYIQENSVEIGQDYEGASDEHMQEVRDFFIEYNKQLREVNLILEQIVDIIANNFDYEDESIRDTIARVKSHE